MNKPIVAATCFVISMLGARGALAGGKPAWCKELPKGDSYDLKDLSSSDQRDVVITLAQATCWPTAEAEAHAADIETARQGWSKRLDMIDSDWADAAAYATQDHATKQNGRVRIHEDKIKTAWSSFDAMDQWGMISEPVGGSGALVLDTDYLVDALGLHLTEIGRAAYVRKCIASPLPVEWATCQGDIARLDYGKIATELRASTAYSGIERMRIRISIDALRKESLPAHAAEIKKLIATDAGYQKLFDASDATWKEWTGRYKTDAAVIELAGAMDDARATNSRKAYAGCEDRTWQMWKSLLATIPAKAFADHDKDETFGHAAMGPILSNPSLYLASVAMLTCMTVGQDHDHHADILIRELGSAMERWPGFRGPRTATQSAILTTGITLDDRDAQIEHPHVDRPFAAGTGSRGGGSGVVGSLKPSGKTAVVTFKKQLVRQVQCAEGRRTNQVTQIRPDGSLIYATVCIRNETVTVDKASDPQTVNARYVEGLAPGMFVSIIEDVVLSARKPGAAVPSMVFGVAVK